LKRLGFLASGGAAFAATSSAARAVTIRASLRDRLTTRAEASNYLATTSHAEVVSFINALDQRGAPIARGSIGKSHGGRDIPFVVASRPMIRTPDEAVASGRPIVLLVGGLDGGEVEGKEALLALLRDLCVSTERTLLEDLVIIFIPLLNPDGNDRFGPQALNRPLQNGPARVGTAADGAGFDLDEDFVKSEAPETRALLAFVQAWKPHVFVDARTDDGSFHDYTVTYAPSLHPAAYYGGNFVRNQLLPKLQKDLHDKFQIESFFSGHFGRKSVLYDPPPFADVRDYGWFAYDDRPRSATNYMGLRGIAAIRINGYAHDIFERRIYNVRAAIETVLGFCSDNDDSVVASYTTATHWLGGTVPVRGALPGTSPVQLPVTWENLALSSEPSDEPGIPKGLKRTGNFSTATMPIFDTFEATLVIDQPEGYLIPYENAVHVKPHLDRHGIVNETLIEPRRFTVRDYVVEYIDHDATAGGHHTTTIRGHWQPPSDIASRFGALYVPGGQPLGPLASVLLEPESDDGLVVWNALDSALKPGFSVPIFRVLSAS
jgi:hypothetical protein